MLRKRRRINDATFYELGAALTKEYGSNKVNVNEYEQMIKIVYGRSSVMKLTVERV